MALREKIDKGKKVQINVSPNPASRKALKEKDFQG